MTAKPWPESHGDVMSTGNRDNCRFGTVIWIIDAEEQWPRALLRAELIEHGCDAVGYVTVRDAIESLPWRRPADDHHRAGAAARDAGNQRSANAGVGDGVAPARVAR